MAPWNPWTLRLYYIYTQLAAIWSPPPPPPNFEERNPQAFGGLWPLETRGWVYIIYTLNSGPAEIRGILEGGGGGGGGAGKKLSFSFRGLHFKFLGNFSGATFSTFGGYFFINS